MRNVPNKLWANHQLHLLGDVAEKKKVLLIKRK